MKIKELRQLTFKMGMPKTYTFPAKGEARIIFPTAEAREEFKKHLPEDAQPTSETDGQYYEITVPYTVN